MLGNRKIIAVFAAVGVMTAATVNCSSSAPPTPEHTTEVTSIHMNADGTQTVVHATITQSQYEAMVAQKRAMQARAANALAPNAPSPGGSDIGQQGQALIQQDTSNPCNPNDLWIYDQAGCPGTPDHMLCLYGSGSNVSLHDWWFTTDGPCPPCSVFYTYWDTIVYSFWPGNDNGALYDTNLSITQTFDAGANCTTADEIDGMNEVTLD